MLHLEIQKEKEAMKTSNFQKYLVGTTAYMKRLSIDTKGCGQLTSNYTTFSDMAAAGVDYWGPVKTIHKGFFKLR